MKPPHLPDPSDVLAEVERILRAARAFEIVTDPATAEDVVFFVREDGRREQLFPPPSLAQKVASEGAPITGRGMLLIFLLIAFLAAVLVRARLSDALFRSLERTLARLVAVRQMALLHENSPGVPSSAISCHPLRRSLLAAGHLARGFQSKPT